ncbi:MAG: hypothetical protein ABIX28_09580 [Vicinamibacterales bacterium]
MRGLIEYRVVLSLAVSAVAGAVGLHVYPFPSDHVVLALVRLERPLVYAGFAYTYAALWVSSSFFLASVGFSCLYIFVPRHGLSGSMGPLPPYPAPEHRADLFVVLGEQHRRSTPERASTPIWLTIPERGLYTGTLIVGAIGSGKTSACMYPYVEQLLAYRASDSIRKAAGLVLEVKGDFCRQVRDILTRHGRADDYVEVSLDSPYRYNPLHNDLDAYALAYGIATLMTNLFGRGKEPFWQQASTNLVKFVILLHQTLDDYVTLFQVYEHVISPDKLRARIEEGERHFRANHRRIVLDKREHLFTTALQGWSWHDDETGTRTWAEWSAELVDALKAAGIPSSVEHATPPARWADKMAQFEAVKRWFEDDWSRIEPKLRTSIVEGISVFLSLFDDNPRVKYTFCPPKDIYDAARHPQGTQGTPLPPLTDLIEQGKIVALNFPIAMNPGLARAIGTMLKQDFQRAVLNRIHRMDTEPTRSQRPVLFVCDEYQAFATTGENEPSGDEKFFSLARQARCNSGTRDPEHQLASFNRSPASRGARCSRRSEPRSS